MNGVNKVIIVGSLGNDPETRTFPDGGAITTISVATSEKWKDKQTGEDRELTEWHRITFTGKLAEIAAQYLRKSSKVYVEGKLKTTKYQDKNTGADKYSTEIMAREMQMLDSKGDGSAPVPAIAPQAAPAPMAAPAPPQMPVMTRQEILTKFQGLNGREACNSYWCTLNPVQQTELTADLG